MHQKQINKNKELIFQLVSFRGFIEITITLAWGFYYILLFQQAGTIDVLFLDALINAVGIWIGYIISAFVKDRLGSATTLRLNFLATGILLMIITLLGDRLIDYFIIITLFRGIIYGSYFPIQATAFINQIEGQERVKTYSFMFIFQSIAGIIIPPIAGLLITVSQNVLIVFFIAGLINIFAVFLPYKKNFKFKSKITSREFTKLLKKKDFTKILLFKLFWAGAASFLIFASLIIPYYILGSELQVGLLFGFIGIVGVIAAYIQRNLSASQLLKTMIGTKIIKSLAVIPLILFFNSLSLVIYESIKRAMTSLFKPGQDDLGSAMLSHFLGHDKNESATEMIIIGETLTLFSRILFFTVGFIFTQILPEINAIQIMLGLGTLTNLVLFFFLIKLSK